MAAYEKQAWLDYVTQFDQSTFADQDIARRLDLMDNIDVSALEEDRLVVVSIMALRRQFTNPLSLSISNVPVVVMCSTIYSTTRSLTE